MRSPRYAAPKRSQGRVLALPSDSHAAWCRDWRQAQIRSMSLYAHSSAYRVSLSTALIAGARTLREDMALGLNSTYREDYAP